MLYNKNWTQKKNVSKMLHNGELVVCSQERCAVSKANSFSKLDQIVVIMSLMCFYVLRVMGRVGRGREGRRE